MNTLIHADIFFVISTIGFIIVAVLTIVMLVYIISILHKVRALSDKIGDSVEDMTSDAKEFVRDLRDSRGYALLFGRSKRKQK